MATNRQTEANRLNAQKSTGPKTEEGKAASRQNALKHGLTGAGVVLPAEAAAAVATRLDQWRDDYRPATDTEEWLFRQLVVCSVRVDRCQDHEVDLRIYQADRAAALWDADQRILAEDTAAALAKRPSRVVAHLSATKHGCEWMITRWRGLAAALDGGGRWSEAQASLALDLLGVPLEFRDAAPFGPDGPSASLVTGELERLEGLEARVLDGLDATERALAEVGHEVAASPALLRLQRYEAASLRELYRARAQLLRGRLAPAAAASVQSPADQRPPAPSPAAALPPLRFLPPTEEQYYARDVAMWKQFFAAGCVPGRLEMRGAEPEPETETETEPSPAPVFEPEPEPARPAMPAAVAAAAPSLTAALLPERRPNRRARRAAERQAARGR